MSKSKKGQNVRTIASQLVLSSYRDSVQSDDVNSESGKEQSKPKEATKGIDWKQESYQLSITVVLEQVSVDSGKHVYQVRLNDNANLAVSAYSKRSKKAVGPSITIPQTKGKNQTLALVYGIHEDGVLSFSPTSGRDAHKGIAEVFGFLLGQIDDAIQYRLQQQMEQASNDDTDKRDKIAQSSENVGEHQEARRGETLRAEILPETTQQEATILVEVDGPVLGNGQADKRGKRR